jgi:predicted S18 family serine protease
MDRRKTAGTGPAVVDVRPTRPGRRLARAAALLAALLVPALAGATPSQTEPASKVQLIRILATTLTQSHDAVGAVTELVVAFAQRADERGIEVTFHTQPGRFSISAQTEVLSAIVRAAQLARLNPDSWTVSLAALTPGRTVSGGSLSAMVGLTVAALAKGDSVPTDRVITGTIAPDGHLGPVEGIGLKLEAAQKKHLQRVIVPDQVAVTEGDWRNPFLLHVSPVDTVGKAYEALTDHPLHEMIYREED